MATSTDEFFAVLTKIGEAKAGRAVALKMPLEITTAAIGDGNGIKTTPSRDQSALVHEVYRAPLSALYEDTKNPGWMIAELILPEDVGGWTAREMMLVDKDGDAIVVSNLPASEKPILQSGSGRLMVIRTAFYIGSAGAGAVVLKVDSGTVLATRDQIDRSIAAHEAEGDPHPQYFTAAEVDAALKAAMARVANQSGLTHLLSPTVDGGWRDVYRAGWVPGWFNQQWGGALVGCEMVDALTGKAFHFEPTTGQIQDDGFNGFSTSQQFTAAQGFRVSEAQAIDAVWFKLYRSGSVSRPVNFSICADNGGVPGAVVANGAGTPINFLQLTSAPTGEWYRIEFPGKPQLQAGTQYHLCATTGVVDANNCVFWRANLRQRYPFGVLSQGTSAGVWTVSPSTANCFLIEPSAASRWLRSGGLFDQKLVFAQGAPANQSKLLCQPARGYFDGKSGMILYRGSSPAGSMLYDVGAGIDHDRLVLGTTAQGYPVVTLYCADRTTVSVTGTASIAAGAHDVAVGYRCVGDGADYLRLYVDGVVVGQSLVGQSFGMSEGWRDSATSWLGGGLPLAPTWDAASLHSFAVFPSVAGWTPSNAALEVSAMGVAGGCLYQNRNGFGTNDSGYYTRLNAGLNNAVGWAVVWRGRVSAGDNSPIRGVHSISVSDGTKTVSVDFQEYFFSVDNGSGARVYVQCDMRQDNTIQLSGRGNDYYVLLNNRLVVDGSGQLTAAAAANQIMFGDTTTQAATNGDVVVRYLTICSTGPLLPAAAPGAELSEFACWSGDQSALLAGLVGDGAPRSVRRLCGVGRGYVGGVDAGVMREARRGISSGPTTTSTVQVPLPEVDAFVIGARIEADFRDAQLGSAATAQVNSSVLCDGVQGPTTYFNVTSTVAWVPVFARGAWRVPLGLHRVDVRWAVGTGTGSSLQAFRNLSIEASI